MNKEKFIKALGVQIRKIRIEKGISQYRLAKNTGISSRALLRFEKGEISPSLFSLSEIAESLDISLEELVKGLP